MTNEVICEKRGAAGHILLNRPQALNALTLNMVRGMSAALDAWERDPAIACVIVQGAGATLRAGDAVAADWRFD